jgi:hypothetical protein
MSAGCAVSTRLALFSTTCAPGSTTSGRPFRPRRRSVARSVISIVRKRLLLFLDDGNIEATNNRLERELRPLVLGRKNWLFTWLDVGGERTATALTIIATCIAHDINPRAYLHLVTRQLVRGWPQRQLRELLPDRIVAAHPELIAGEPEPAALLPGT